MRDRRPIGGGNGASILAFRQRRHSGDGAWRILIRAAQVLVVSYGVAVTASTFAPSLSVAFPETGWLSTSNGVSDVASAALLADDGGRRVSMRFGFCAAAGQRNCIVDGDTLRHDGDTIRIADIDTPETVDAKCASERERGHRAKARLADLLNAAPFLIVAAGGSDRDRYGRQLRVLTREDGRSIGAMLVAEGHARPWTGRRLSWCV